MEVTIDDLSLFVISIIRTGAALRFLYCMVRLSGVLVKSLTISAHDSLRNKNYTQGTVAFNIIQKL